MHRKVANSNVHASRIKKYCIEILRHRITKFLVNSVICSVMLMSTFLKVENMRKEARQMKDKKVVIVEETHSMMKKIDKHVRKI